MQTSRNNGPRQRHLISISQAAEYAGVHPKTIRRRISDGSLPAYRMGKRLIRVDLREVEALLRPVPSVAQTGRGGAA